MFPYLRAIVLLLTLLSSGADRSVACHRHRLFNDVVSKVEVDRSEIVQAPLLPPPPATPLVLNLCDSEIDEEEDSDQAGRFFLFVSIDLIWEKPVATDVGGSTTSALNTGVVATIAFAIRC